MSKKFDVSLSLNRTLRKLSGRAMVNLNVQNLYKLKKFFFHHLSRKKVLHQVENVWEDIEMQFDSLNSKVFDD